MASLRVEVEELVEQHGFGAVLRMLHDVGHDLHNPALARALQVVDGALVIMRGLGRPQGATRG